MNILNKNSENLKNLTLWSAIFAAIFGCSFAFATSSSPSSSPLPSTASESAPVGTPTPQSPRDVDDSSDKGVFKHFSVGISALAMSPIYYNTDTVMGVLFSVGYDFNQDMGFRGFAANTSGRSSFWFGGLDFEFTPVHLGRVGNRSLVDLGGLVGGTIYDTPNNNYNAFTPYIGPRINLNFSNTLQLTMSYRFTIYNAFEGGFNYRF